MVLNKGMFSSHEDQIIYFKTDIFKSGLKVNDNKYNSRLKDIHYLIYIITRDSIKPYPMKVQGMMDTEIPNTTTENQKYMGCSSTLVTRVLEDLILYRL